MLYCTVTGTAGIATAAVAYDVVTTAHTHSCLALALALTVCVATNLGLTEIIG